MTRAADPTAPVTPRDGKATTADLAKGGAIGLAGSITGALMGLLLVVVLGHALGDVGAGVVLQAIGIFTIVLALARCGMDSTALWLLPRLREEDPSRLRGAVLLMSGISAGVGIACAAALLLLTRVPALAKDPVADAVGHVAWALPVAAMMLLALAANRALGDLHAYVLIGNIMLPVTRVLAVGLAAGAGISATGTVTVWALPLLPALLLAFLALRSRLAAHPDPVPRSGRADLSGRLLRFGLPRVLSAVLEQLLLWLDVVIVGILAGPAAAGVYGAASRLVMAGAVVDTAIRTVVSPWFSRLMHRGDVEGLSETFRTATTWLVLFSTPVYVWLACFAVLPLRLIGPEFATGATVVAVLCVGSTVTFLAGNVHSLLVMSGRSGLAAANKVVAVGVNVLLLLVLVPRWGIVGAAVAWSAATLLDALLASIQVRTTLGLPLGMTAGFYPLVVAVMTVGPPAMASRLVLGATWIGFAVAVGLGCAAFAAWARHDARTLELAALSSLIRRRSAGASP